jgi:hypothetical protein
MLEAEAGDKFRSLLSEAACFIEALGLFALLAARFFSGDELNFQTTA